MRLVIRRHRVVRMMTPAMAASAVVNDATKADPG
jgi:hypothetical protein